MAADRAWLDETRQTLLSRADAMLQAGLGSAQVRRPPLPRRLRRGPRASDAVGIPRLRRCVATLQKHTDVAAALQVFYYLGQLPTQVKALLDGLHAQFQASIKRTFDVRSLQAESAETAAAAAGAGAGAGASGGLGANLISSIRRVGEPPSGQSSMWATVLWIRVEKLFDALVAAWQKVSDGAADATVGDLPLTAPRFLLPPPFPPRHGHGQVYLLERVLARKRDAATGTAYIDFVRKVRLRPCWCSPARSGITDR